MGKKRITGIDRALMMLIRQARKYWRFYSPIRLEVRKERYCVECKKKVVFVEVDHNPPLGKRPRTIEEFPNWWNRLMSGPQEGLCTLHHKKKTNKERKKRIYEKRKEMP